MYVPTISAYSACEKDLLLPLFFLEFLDVSEDAPRREGCDAQVARLRRCSQAADHGRVQEHSPITKPYVCKLKPFYRRALEGKYPCMSS